MCYDIAVKLRGRVQEKVMTLSRLRSQSPARPAAKPKKKPEMMFSQGAGSTGSAFCVGELVQINEHANHFHGAAVRLVELYGEGSWICELSK